MSPEEDDPCLMCDMAIELGAKTKEQVDCSKCMFIVPLLPGNNQFMEIVNYIGSTLISPQGAVNFEAVKYALEQNSLNDRERKDFFEKLSVYVSVILRHAAEDN